MEIFEQNYTQYILSGKTPLELGDTHLIGLQFFDQNPNINLGIMCPPLIEYFVITDNNLVFLNVQCDELILIRSDESGEGYVAIFTPKTEISPISLIETPNGDFWLNKSWTFGELFISFILIGFLLAMISKSIWNFFYPHLVRFKK